MAVKIALVRHGATDYTSGSRYCGWDDPPLNARGRRQAARLGERLAAEEFQGAWSSDLARAAETAEIILAGRPEEARPDERLRELDFGEWEGLTCDEICARDGERCRAWVDRPLTPVPGGEGLGDMEARVVSFLEELQRDAASAERAVLVVAHGGPIAVALCRAAGRPLTGFWNALPPPASVSEILLGSGKGQVLRTGSVEHLEERNG